MSDDILRIEHLWQRHRRWKRRAQSVKEALIGGLKGRRSEYEDFWALQDLSLSVARGERIGFCGANGAGKSTLLRVLAGILPPTHGRVTVRGSLATLLELGSGFLPELTGRENIELNGAILGVSDEQMRGKLPAIVEFADLGDFIDSPVKTYSTGMYMRLGFAIASHVDADILLLDEVLAVGDVAFQEKCADWLERLRSSDTTVLVVSHDLEALITLCDRVAWLDRGRLVTCGEPEPVVVQYAESHRARQAQPAEATEA